MKNIEFTINVLNKERILEKLEKFNKVAKRLNKKEIEYTFTNNRIEKDNINEIIEIEDLTVTVYEELKINDYEIIASINHTYLDKNFVKAYKELNKEYISELESVNSYCEHCNSNRKRNMTYIVENIKTGERKQIGKTCLKDYIGHDVIKSITFYDTLDEIITEIGNIKTEKHDIFFKINDLLNLVDEEIRENGYHSAKNYYEYGEYSTGMIIYNKILKNLVEGKTIPISHKDYTLEVEIVKNYDTNSDYYNALKTVLQHEYCKIKDIKLLATFFVALKYIKKELNIQQEKKVSNWIGQEKEKIQIKVILKKIVGYATQYGWTNIYIFKDENNNTLTWKTTKETNFEEGDKLEIKATIKEHLEYNGEKQTSILRVKTI